MEVSREMLQAVAELWTCYLQQKLTVTEVATMLWLGGMEIKRLEECAS